MKLNLLKVLSEIDDPLHSFAIDNLYLGVVPPLEPVDDLVNVLILAVHQPLGDVVLDLLSDCISDDEDFILLVDVKI
jgi:hypothetical protein